MTRVFDGELALVTDGGSGIGLACAAHLARDGLRADGSSVHTVRRGPNLTPLMEMAMGPLAHPGARA